MELWKVVESHPDYEVSNKGRVRSFKGVNQWASRRTEPRLLSLSKDGSGYLFVILDTNNPHKQVCKVHRLVMDAFSPTEEVGLEVNHLNENKEDNRVENLQWVTRRENQIHSFGKCIRLKSPQQEILEFESIRLAAETIGLDPAALSRLVNGKYKQTKGWTLHG